MARYDPRASGVDRQDVLNNDEYRRDSRSYSRIVKSILYEPVVSAIVVIGCYFLMLLFPQVWELIFIATICFALFAATDAKTIPLLPFRLPRHSDHTEDLNNPLPGRKKLGPPEGDIYLGQELGTDEQAWMSFKDFLTHMMAAGQTGSGKTETLISLALNFLTLGRGLSYTDAKASPKLVHKVWYLVSRYGFEDNFLFVNYAVGEEKDVFNLDSQVTNHIAIVQMAGTEEISNLFTTLMAKAEGQNSGFAQNAQLMVRAVTAALVELRDNRHIELSWKVIQQHYTLEKCLLLCHDARLSEKALNNMKAFMGVIAGVNLDKDFASQSRTAHDQFGYVAGYVGRGLGMLIDTYGHVFGETYSDVSMYDVFHRDRVLITGIPALQFAEDELSLIGKMTLAINRSALSKGIQREVEGTSYAVRANIPYKGGPPFLNILDEFKYISAKGMSIAGTQGREFGVASILGYQSQSGLESVDGGKSEADEWFSNTGIKAFGKIDGDKAINDKLTDLLGKVTTSQIEARSRERSWIGTPYDDQRIVFREQDPISPRDLTKQLSGEMVLIRAGVYSRVRSMYIKTPYDDVDPNDESLKTAPETVLLINPVKLNSLVPIKPVDIKEVFREQSGVRSLKNVLKLGIPEGSHDPEIVSYLNELDKKTTIYDILEFCSTGDDYDPLQSANGDLSPFQEVESNENDEIQDIEPPAEMFVAQDWNKAPGITITNSTSNSEEDEEEDFIGDEDPLDPSSSAKKVVVENASEIKDSSDLERAEIENALGMIQSNLSLDLLLEDEPSAKSDVTQDDNSDDEDDDDEGESPISSLDRDLAAYQRPIYEKENIKEEPVEPQTPPKQASLFSGSGDLFDVSNDELIIKTLKHATAVAQAMGLDANESDTRKMIEGVVQSYKEESDLATVNTEELKSELKKRLQNVFD